MTSRPASGINTQAQRPLAGGVHRVANRSNGVLQQQQQQQNRHAVRQSEAVIDLTDDGDKSSAVDRTPTAGGAKSSSSALPNPKQGTAVPGGSLTVDTTTRQFSRTRPPLYSDSPSRADPASAKSGQSTPTTSASEKSATAVAASAALPFPSRPGAHCHENRRGSSKPDGSGISGRSFPDMSLGVFEAPLSSKCFPQGKTADFFPWIGNHQEDLLSDQLVRVGVQNKHSNLNELNTARPSLWSHLKNKPGLQTLSALFVAVLEKRQASGRLTAPSTFKPPPRVTLTDTKRENWLWDLANPSQPLRRLSRTIPHGIRGKALLEQCLAKNIPTARAVWLAKCVGANDLRAFKRKGQVGTTNAGGEQKWIREWTLCVEQLLESTIAACGKEDWRKKMDYVIRLSSHLFTDHLLDQDQFLDWLLSSLRAAPSDRLPVWLLHAQIYWKDLVACRKRGVVLAECLLSQRATLTADDEVINERVLKHVDVLSVALARRNTDCLLVPQKWAGMKEQLKSIADKYPNTGLSTIITQLDIRNTRLLQTSAKDATAESPKKGVVKLLDSVKFDANIEALSDSLFALVSSPPTLIGLTLKWASSAYRYGKHRVYLAVRLLRRWGGKGIDTNEAVLAFLALSETSKSVDVQNLYRIIAELVRSKHFSIGRYFQYLVATGTIDGLTDVEKRHSHRTRLISEMPLHNLPEHILNLRDHILHRLGVSVKDENRTIEAIQDSIAAKFPGLCELEMVDVQATDISSLRDYSITIKLSVGRWIRDQVAQKVVNLTTPEGKLHTTQQVSTIVLDEFVGIRSYLEQLEDFPILADVLGISMSSDDYFVLAAVADTLNFHAMVFAAIGALVPLMKRLADRYSVMRTSKALEKHFLLALSDLCSRLQVDQQVAQIVKYDLFRCDQQMTAAVCSPASDNMAEILQTASVETAGDEIEAILSSGNSMDEQMMARVFFKIVKELEEKHQKAVTSLDPFGSWFARLRCFDDKAFDGLVVEWLSEVFFGQQTPLLRAVIPILVGARCLTLAEMAKLCGKTFAKLGELDRKGAASVSVAILDAVLPTAGLDGHCGVEDAYRFRLMQQNFCEQSTAAFTWLLRQVLELNCAVGNDAASGSPFQALVSDERLYAVLKITAVKDITALVGELFKGGANSLGGYFAQVKRISDRLLGSLSSQGTTAAPAVWCSGADDAGDPSAVALQERIGAVVVMADELSLPYCQLALQAISHLSSTSADGGDDVTSALFEAIKAAVDQDQSNWAELVAGLDSSLMGKICEHAEGQILSAIASLGKGGSLARDQVTAMDRVALPRYLSVVELTAPGISSDSHGQVAAVLIERFKTLLDALSDNIEERESANDSIVGNNRIDTLCRMLDALLHLAVIHRGSFQDGKSLASNQASILWTLRSFLVHPKLQQQPDHLVYAFDVAALFTDDLTDTVRTQLAKLSSSRPPHTPTTNFLFYNPPSPDAWLGLISPNLPLQVSVNPHNAIQSPLPQTPNTPTRVSAVSTPGRPLTPQAGLPAPPPTSQQQQQQHQPPTPLPQQQQRLTPGMPPQPQQPQQQSQPQMQQLPLTLQQLQARPDLRPVPLALRRWEILPDPPSGVSGAAGVNDTALSLSLFEARRVA